MIGLLYKITTRLFVLFMLSAVMKLNGESGAGQCKLSMRHVIFLYTSTAVTVNQKNTDNWTTTSTMSSTLQMTLKTTQDAELKSLPSWMWSKNSHLQSRITSDALKMFTSSACPAFRFKEAALRFTEVLKLLHATRSQLRKRSTGIFSVSSRLTRNELLQPTPFSSQQID